MLIAPYPCWVSLSYLYRNQRQLSKIRRGGGGRGSTVAQVLSLTKVTATKPMVLNVSFLKKKKT